MLGRKSDFLTTVTDSNACEEPVAKLHCDKRWPQKLNGRLCTPLLLAAGDQEFSYGKQLSQLDLHVTCPVFGYLSEDVNSCLKADPGDKPQ